MPHIDLPLPELEQYRCSVVPPADLDDFWADTLSGSRAAGRVPRIERVDTGLTLVESHDVTFSGFAGEPVKAWLHRPAGVTGDLPVVVWFMGYGSGRSLAHQTTMWPLAGYATLVMDNRGQGWGGGFVGETPDSGATGPASPGLLTRGILHRDTSYLRRLYTDAVLAVDAARALPGIAADHVAVAGVSQGGGLALAVSGLARGLTAVMADVPYLCDFPRGAVTATAGPSLEIATFLATQRQHERRVFDVLAYFDGAVLVRRADAPALFSVGLMDQTCPPSTVYAAFNAYAGVKELRRYTFNDHEGGQFHQEAEQLRWLAARLP